MPHDPLDWLPEQLARLEQSHLLRERMIRTGAQRPQELHTGADRLINFSSNDYLGLAAERLSQAAITATTKSGWGSGASPLVTGRSDVHAELEQALADFEQVEAALLFTSGYAANTGTIAALVGPEDCIYSDAKNHASLIDGCRLSKAAVAVYPHRDIDALRSALQQGSNFRRRLIVTDTLFSMDGDIAPLADIAELAERHRAMLLVDEAHATGVFGPQGRGLCEACGVEQDWIIRIGTLSKALGSAGGFVAGREGLVQWLANRARSYVFSTASPAAYAAAGLEAVRVIQAEPQRREALLSRAAYVHETLSRQGWQLGADISQIIPIYVGEANECMQLATALRKRGLLVPGIRPPSVPQGEALLRISLSWAHSAEDIEQLLTALDDLRSSHGSQG